LRSAQRNADEPEEGAPDGFADQGAEAIDGPDAEARADVPDTSLAPVSHVGTRRDEILERLQDGYERVVELVTSIQQHMEESARHEGRTVESLQQMRELLGELPALSERQLDELGKLGGQLDQQRMRAEELAGTVADLPDLARRQGHALDQVREQMRIRQESDVALAGKVEGLDGKMEGLEGQVGGLDGRLEGVDGSIGRLSEAASDHSRRLEGIDRNFEAGQRQVADELQAQRKKLTRLIWATLIVSAIGVIGALTAILLQFLPRSS
jgi:chromosome segregation ATPase